MVLPKGRFGPIMIKSSIAMPMVITAIILIQNFSLRLSGRDCLLVVAEMVSDSSPEVVNNQNHEPAGPGTQTHAKAERYEFKSKSADQMT